MRQWLLEYVFQMTCYIVGALLCVAVVRQSQAVSNKVCVLNRVDLRMNAYLLR